MTFLDTVTAESSAEAAHSSCPNCEPPEAYEAVREETRRAAAWTGSIAVVCPARNEPKLGATVKQLVESKGPGTSLRFVVIDDGSSDGCARQLAGHPLVQLVRNERPLGQGMARNLGVILAGPADVYLSIDAHIQNGTPLGLERLAVAAQETQGVVGCLSAAWNKPENRTVRAGQSWKTSPTGAIRGIVGSAWNHTYTERLQPVDIPQGACYAFTRSTYERLGGFRESYNDYGFFDRDLAVNCRFLDIPMLVHTGVTVAHWYRKKRPYPQSGIGFWRGLIESFRTMFRPEIFDEVFRPHCEKAARATHDSTMTWLLNDLRFLDLQSVYESCKQRSDDEVLRWMGLRK